MKYNINLLPQKKKDFTGRLFYFILHYLRYILVITQLVVIIVFFYRFKIDQEIIDTNESLMQKQEILKVSKPIINEAAAISFKIKEIKDILDRQDEFDQMLQYLLSRFPKGLTLSKLAFSKETVIFDGKALDALPLQLFYNRLRKENRFQQVKLGNMQKKLGDIYFSFELTDYIPKND